jgi:hypothetical protein
MDGKTTGSYPQLRMPPMYVAEFQFRYNNRLNPDIFGAVIGGC